MEHYFTRSPTSPDKVTIIEDVLRGRTLRFKTSSGVFSKNKIDTGTQVLVDAVRITPDETLLDVGCGYGVIGISLSFFCNSVLLIDINERACRLTKENIVLNEVPNAYVVCGTPLCIQKLFDVVVMNPPLRAGKKVVFQLIEESKNCLTHTGKMYIVARTRQGAKSIYSFVDRLFSETAYVSLKSGYRVIKGELH